MRAHGSGSLLRATLRCGVEPAEQRIDAIAVHRRKPV
jgi:hypothetical protein